MLKEGETDTEKSTNKFRKFLTAYIFTKFGLYNVVTILYLLLGGLIFHLTEGYYERERRNEAALELENLNSTVKSFLISLNISNETLSSQKLSLFTSYIVQLSQNFSSLNSVANQNPMWTYGRSVYFSFIAITTIGYGQLAPITRLGQVFLCVYAFIGIPIFILLITDTSKRLTDAFNWLVLRRMGKERYRWIAILIALIVGLITTILIPAAILGSIEGWAYTTATYFCFVSLSTIGFGDFVLGANPRAAYNANPGLREFYVLSSVIWLFFGLMFLGILIAQISTGIEMLESQICKFIQKFTTRKYVVNSPDGKDDTATGDANSKRRGTKMEILPK